MTERPLERRVDDLADRWQAAWAGGGGFGACCTPDVQYEDPAAPDPLRGPDRLDAHAALLRRAFPDLVVERTGQRLGDGAYGCIPWRAHGSHHGDLPHLPATHREIVLDGVHYIELRDGLVHRARGFFDLYDAATQLGLLPRRGTLAETALLLVRGFGLRAIPRR